jgi:hypothetical protein
MDQALNVGFFVFHTAWIVFICAGWIWRRTRPWQLAAAALTVASWVGLGLWFGWGYCPCTDWHWQVRARLGYRDPPSYIELLIEAVLGIDVAGGVADTVAVTVLIVAVALGVALTVRAGPAAKSRG